MLSMTRQSSCSWSSVRQLEAVNRRLLAELARRVPLFPGKEVLAFADIDAMQEAVCWATRPLPVRAARAQDNPWSWLVP